jgi:hypothetical protein
MSATTTSGGRTGHSTYKCPTRARCPRREASPPDQRPRSDDRTCSADSSTNTKPPQHETELMHPTRCGRIAVCESSGIARTSSRSRRRGRSSPPSLPARGSRSTRCALPPTLRQPPSSCSGGSWTTSIGPESGSQSRRRTATGADSAGTRPAAEAGQAVAPAAIWSRTCVVTWSNSSTNWS